MARSKTKCLTGKCKEEFFSENILKLLRNFLEQFWKIVSTSFLNHLCQLNQVAETLPGEVTPRLKPVLHTILQQVGPPVRQQLGHNQSRSNSEILASTICRGHFQEPRASSDKTQRQTCNGHNFRLQFFLATLYHFKVS